MEKYQGKVRFLFVYCREAHPADVPLEPWRQAIRLEERIPRLAQTTTWAERAERARQFREWKQTARLVLVDEDGPGSVQRLYGAGDLLTVVVAPGGRVALRQAVALDVDLDRLLEDLLAGRPAVTGPAR